MHDAERLTRLEERYAHLQKHTGQQDKAMLALADEVKKLRQELAVMRAAQAGGSEPGEAADERPPHY
jgi:SlyX protein